ncbi:hypothetical protein FAI40_09020 [Acetobacteraceae bacterium]|nr:hypothetical protein FAI40_09020 [Acetobacteraceae bacterium]
MYRNQRYIGLFIKSTLIIIVAGIVGIVLLSQHNQLEDQKEAFDNLSKKADALEVKYNNLQEEDAARQKFAEQMTQWIGDLKSYDAKQNATLSFHPPAIFWALPLCQQNHGYKPIVKKVISPLKPVKVKSDELGTQQNQLFSSFAKDEVRK